MISLNPILMWKNKLREDRQHARKKISVQPWGPGSKGEGTPNCLCRQSESGEVSQAQLQID